ncbi:hypothetical protein [Tepidibacter thalassicus]|uniref:Uncharacterized protein n=1 Tax=Tepidibacter thalassicus DSM 15285 TaxID=1123350 RepID=A0A1M5SUR8_9FIRM|nr:hypothetical protein [Tepidibacter thalassicus]SHH42262.1 hypothetical protein SAMN02744040_01921 [Tepidibacter thalassicus DSM 15285]
MEKLLKITTYISGTITVLLGLVYICVNFVFPFFIKTSVRNCANLSEDIGDIAGPTKAFVAHKVSAGLSLGMLILIFGVITIVLFLLKNTTTKCN